MQIITPVGFAPLASSNGSKADVPAWSAGVMPAFHAPTKKPASTGNFDSQL